MKTKKNKHANQERINAKDTYFKSESTLNEVLKC
jgi:hypothetical protein